MCDLKLKQFSIDLHKINAIKFGEFQLKIGILSPIYCDLRVIISYPKLLDILAELLIEKIDCERYDVICGVPYTALPIATVVSLKTGLPMIMRRKEAKNYGTKKMIEGNYKPGDKCLIIEDIITSGSSILETVRDLKNAGLSVTNALVVLNREQGGEKILNENGIIVESLLTVNKLMEFLFESDNIDRSTVDKVTDFLKRTQVNSMDIKKSKQFNRLEMNLSTREKYCANSNTMSKKLYKIISEKESNLCVAMDTKSASTILKLADQIGPYICILKTHVDIIEDFTNEFAEQLKRIASTHNFLIMEDRKFADIGNVVSLQFNAGLFRISNWADLVTTHTLPGESLIKALTESKLRPEIGLFLVAEMSSSGNLCSDEYVNASVKLAQDYPECVVGIVCQSPKFIDTPALLQLTPGIQLDKSGDNLGQQYNSPEIAVLERGADIGVVGRGITESKDPVQAANEYRRLLWNAYLKRIE